MSLNKKISDDLKDAMKAKDEVRLSSLRMLKSSLKNLQVEKGTELDDLEIQSVISSMIRKGKEAANEFNKADREDLAEKENAEVNISVFDVTGKKVQNLLNKQLSKGTHLINVDVSGLNSGVYYYRLQSGAMSATKRMLIVD